MTEERDALRTQCALVRVRVRVRARVSDALRMQYAAPLPGYMLTYFAS